MALKLHCVGVFLSRHISGDLDHLCVKHVSTRQRESSAQTWLIHGISVKLDFTAVFQIISSCLRLIPASVYSSSLVPHISPIIAFPPPVSWGAQAVPRGSLTLALLCQICQKLQFGVEAASLSALMATFTHCVVCQDYRLSDLHLFSFPLLPVLKSRSFLWWTKPHTHTQSKHKDVLAHTKPLKNHRNSMWFYLTVCLLKIPIMKKNAVAIFSKAVQETAFRLVLQFLLSSIW